MSVTRKPLRVRHFCEHQVVPEKHDWCDPIITLVVEGHHDIYRLARHLETGQVEFCAIGRGMLKALDRFQPGLVRALTAQMGPARYGYRGVAPRKLTAEQASRKAARTA